MTAIVDPSIVPGPLRERFRYWFDNVMARGTIDEVSFAAQPEPGWSGRD